MRVVFPVVAPTPPLPDDPALLREIYRRMYLIRHFELRVNELFLKGKVPGTIHLAHGQEASAVGTCLALRPDDTITLTHRPHGQALAKGMDPRPLLAEILGKADGCSGGKGGSMHVADMALGIFPAIAIVAAAVPIATGLAFAYRRRGSNQVACTFLGEGAVNKGEWHEAMNLAAVWRLPVIFLCENNLYASTTHVTDVMLTERISDRAAAYGMPGVTVDGNDPITVLAAVREAADRARAGDGPTFVECLTYRRGGHKRDDPATYRPQEEVATWLDRDPVVLFRSRLLAESTVSGAAIEAIEAEVMAALDAATEFALASPYPALERAYDHVYA